MYVPNSQKWMKYYENTAKGYHNPYVDQKGERGKQIGGSLTGSQGTFMVPIEDASHSINARPSNPVTVKLVSPSQQVVEQAKSEPQAERKTIKRKASSKSVSSPKRRRTVNTSKKGKKKLRKTSIKKRAASTRKGKAFTKKANLRKTKGKKSKRKTNKKTAHFKDIFA